MMRNFAWCAVVVAALVMARPALGEDLKISVKAMESGQPIAGAEVKVDPQNGDAVKGKTGADGAAVVALPAGSEDGVEVSVSAEGRAPVVSYWFKGLKKPRPDHFDFTMENGTTVGGVVVDENGKPIEGATVMLAVRKKYPNPEQRLNVSYVGVKTNAEGKWTYAQVPAVFEEIDVGAYEIHHLGQYAFYPMDTVKDVESLRAGTAKTVLQSGAPLTVSVSDDAGKPLAGAKVGYGEDRVASNIIPAAETDAAGQATMGAPAGITAVLTVMAKGHAPQQQRVTIGKEATTVHFQLAKAVPLTGKIVDAEGKPLDGVWVFFDTWHGTRPFDTRIITKPDGTFTWDDAPADDVFADVLKQGYADQRRVRMRVGEENVVKLHLPTSFTGTVVDAETGKPVEKFHIVLGIDFKNGGGVSWDRQSDEGGEGKGGKFQREFSYPYPARVLRVEAEGYLPADSDSIPLDGQAHRFTYRLAKGKPVEGVVTDAQGKGLAGAQVLLLTATQGVQVQNGEVPEWESRSTPMTKTAADGKFSFAAQKDRYALLVLAPAGYAQVTQEALAKSGAITLTLWARIEGEVRIGTKPGANKKVEASYYNQTANDRDNPLGRAFFEGTAVTDAKGHFVMERVFATDVQVGREVQISPNRTAYTGMEKIKVQPGETVHVIVGGRGRPLVGRAEIPDSVQKAGFVPGMSSLTTQVEEVKWTPPADVMATAPDARKQWFDAWKKTEEGQRVTKAQEEAAAKRKFYPVVLETNGRLTADEVPAGVYILQVSLSSLPTNGSTCPVGGEEIASGSMTVTVPEIPGGVSDEPLDIGTVPLTEIKRVAVGEIAPEFVTKTVDGKELKLSDYRGKYLLLDFWATWCGPCVAEVPHLKEAWAAAGTSPHFAMVSLSLDTDAKAPAAFVKAQGVFWTQGFLGEWSKDQVTKAYGVQGIPSVWLIDPEGRVVAKELRGEAIKQAVESALAKVK